MLKSLIYILVAVCFASPALAAQPTKLVAAPDGAMIAYYPLIKAGGPPVPVIVLSGGPGTDSSYMRVGGALDKLAQSRSVIFYDQRGTSQSSDSKGDETIDQYVEDIEAIRKALGAPKIDFIGHSFGGYLAMAYTAKYPDHVRGLVLVSSAPPKMSDIVQLVDSVFPDRIEAWRSKRATLGKDNPGKDYEIFQSMEFVDKRALAQFLKAVEKRRYNMEVNNTVRQDVAKLDYWPQVERFTQKALVINGRFDVIVAPSIGWRLQKALPNSTYQVIEAAGHLPHIERPDAFLAVVRPFFAALDRTDAGDRVTRVSGRAPR